MRSNSTKPTRKGADPIPVGTTRFGAPSIRFLGSVPALGICAVLVLGTLAGMAWSSEGTSHLPSTVRSPSASQTPPGPTPPTRAEGGLAGTGLSVVASASPNATDLGLNVTFAASAQGGTSPYNYSWRFSDGTTPGFGSSLTRKFLLAEVLQATVWGNDSSGQSSNATVNVSVNFSPDASIEIKPTPTDVGVPVYFAAVNYGGTAPFQDSWNLGDGTTFTGTSLHHTYSAPGTYLVTLFDNDSVGRTGEARAYLDVGTSLSSPSLTALPSVVEVGDELWLNASIQGGSAPFTYDFSGLPTGCLPNGNATFGCFPNSTGTFEVNATIYDASAASMYAIAPVTVVPALSLVNFSASPSNLVVGRALSLDLVLGGGAGGITVVYSGLPGGCLSSNTTTLQCVPSSPGTFLVNVSAMDGRGHKVVASTTVIVNPLASPPPSGGGAPPSGNSTNGTSKPHGTTGTSIPWDLYALVAVAIAAVLLLAVYRWGPKRFPPAPTSKGQGASTSTKGSRSTPPSDPEEEDLDAPVT